MTRRQDFATKLPTAVLLCALGIAGCGKVGPLEQPAPLFGQRAKAEYYAQKTEQQQSAADRAAAQAAVQGSAERETANTSAPNTASKNTRDPVTDDAPLSTRDVQDSEQKMTTPRDAPAPGAPDSMGPMVSVRPPNP